ncbi:hypothetical protein Hneap_2378 [Halothiobacillus neapolitanus c2]|uniref:Uncharacterized protein n=1 Tax=Halothiobacillus neapolitanus (strain ATCC 23641 / DSM 15147 / CIP 104769 / NCIMB 8539 / c2) TaxID=555778 RepID=D0KXJ9_HALNC|nr:hypothetical protein Hneap_2378 [Halothiobacillus neapolitanus c2]
MSGNARKRFTEGVFEATTHCDPRLDVLDFDARVWDVFFRTCQ